MKDHLEDVGRKTKEIEQEKDQPMTIFLHQTATMTTGTDLVTILNSQGKDGVHYPRLWDTTPMEWLT